jgi:hypothetical protein
MTQSEFVKEARKDFRAAVESLKVELETAEFNLGEELTAGQFDIFGSATLFQRNFDRRVELIRREADIQRRIQQERIEFLRKQVAADKASKGELIAAQKQLERMTIESERRIQQAKEERNRAATQAAIDTFSTVSTLSGNIFSTWKEDRERELEAQGKTERQKNEILKAEGKRRFNFMKAAQIAEASVNTATAATRALSSAPPPFNFGLAAAVAAAGMFRIRQIAGMSIGDKLSGGGAAGSISGQFTQLNADVAARRAQEFGTQQRRQRERQTAEQINNAADKIENAAKNMQVTMADSTAERAVDRAMTRKNKFRR